MHAPKPGFGRRTALALVPVFIVIASLISPIGQASAATTTWLPFDLASTATLRSSPKKVFANWVPTLPISIDNKAPTSDYYAVNYLTPTGENGKHAAYGGFLRDRPQGRAPLTGSDWRLQDMKTEVRNAIAAGIDGFTVVIYTLPPPNQTNQQWTNIRLMMQAAAEVDSGFKIIPMPDMTASVGGVSAATLAARMAELSKFSSAYRINGKMVLSPFCAEMKSVAWWTDALAQMSSAGAPITFFPTFLDEQKYGPAFAGITYGMGNWGSRDPAYNDPNITYSTGPVGRALKVQTLGDKWMQPVSFGDSRPRAGTYWESANTETLRNSWAVARKADADWTQLTTWNDLPEGSGMQPSMKHGYSVLDLNAYFISWFKTGVAPTVTRDAIYLTHRTQTLAAQTSFKQTLYMTKLLGGTKGRDTIEALTFAKEASTVSITVGSKTYSCAVQAGLDRCLVPLSTGTVSAKLVRGSTSVATLTSPYAVVATPKVQDFEYTASSSLRQGTSASAPTTPTTPSTATTTTLVPTEDSFVDAGSPTKSHGKGASLLVDGSSAKNAYLKFALPAAPAGKTLTSAVLKVRTTDEEFAGSPGTFQVATAGTGWSENTVVWTNRPGTTSGQIGTLKATTRNTTYSSTLAVNSIKPLQGQTMSLALLGSDVDGIFLVSKDGPVAANRPQLVLTYQ